MMLMVVLVILVAVGVILRAHQQDRKAERAFCGDLDPLLRAEHDGVLRLLAALEEQRRRVEEAERKVEILELRLQVQESRLKQLGGQYRALRNRL